MYDRVAKPKENERTAIANAVGQREKFGSQAHEFVDNRPEPVFQRRIRILSNDSIYEAVQKKENKKCNKILDPSPDKKGVFQRKIIVNNSEVDKDAILDNLVIATTGSVHAWLTSNGMTSILKRNRQNVKAEITATESNTKATNYLKTNLRNQIFSILEKYNSENRTFENNAHLETQLIQDIKLGILRLDDILGVDHHNGQFSQTDPSGRGKALRIYRTTTRIDWNNYLQSGSVAGLLHGHGGSLGQALDYFYKSKNSDTDGPLYDNVIFELKFTKLALNAIDYNTIALGGEGGGPNLGRLTGKKEQNDILGESNIFSVNLGACKDLILSMNPVVRRVDEMKGEGSQYSKRLIEIGVKHGEYPVKNLTEKEREELEGLKGH
jgi:hypothetical protein